MGRSMTRSGAGSSFTTIFSGSSLTGSVAFSGSSCGVSSSSFFCFGFRCVQLFQKLSFFSFLSDSSSVAVTSGSSTTGFR